MNAPGKKEDHVVSRKNIYRAQMFAYLLIVAIGISGFWQAEQTRRDICRATENNRQVSADLTRAIQSLGTDLVTSGLDRPLTPDQRKSLDRLQQFERDRMDALGPQLDCD